VSSIRARAPRSASPTVRRAMQANVPRDTKPEVRFRSVLHAAGLRFRKDCRPEALIHCKADIVFPSRRVCVFIDGCFWHGCPEHFRTPLRNGAWWTEKIEDNKRRDREKTSALRASGWVVFRFWEHELRRDGLKSASAKVQRALRSASHC